MNKIYKITFKPVEPYFFGNEKNFVFPGQNQSSSYSNSYFIRSEKIPSQSTILGALRYIFLPYKWESFSSTDTKESVYEKHAENNRVIGTSSFDIDCETVQEFGIIKRISPVFICGKNGSGESFTLIPTPMDHNKADDKKQKDENLKHDKYSPFDEYCQVNTSERAKLYANDFDVKQGLAHSWVSLENSKIYTESDLFENDLRIGINRRKDKDGFFKKNYCMLRTDFSFAVYAELDIDNPPETGSVFLGQGKSAFTVALTEEKDDLMETCEFFVKSYERFKNSSEQQYSLIYCLSDCFVSDFDESNILFCAIDTKDYRAFKTYDKGRIEKGGTLYRLLKAGSVIITENPDEWISKNKNANAENIGFNSFIKLGGTK